LSQANQVQRSVLLLEEDPVAVAHARQACALSDPPIQLTVVQNSDEALAWMADVTAQNLPNLLLLDLNLPKLSGLAVLRRLRMEVLLKDLPVVVFSSLHEPVDVQQSYQVGANSFVEKPGSVADFSELFSTQIAYWVKLR
jgi:two-component system, response regulator